MSITKEIAVGLTHGTTLYSSLELNRDGTPLRCRVTGKCKTWKTRPDAFKLPVKYGLYQSFYIENDEFAAHWHLDEDEAKAAFPSGKIVSTRYVKADGMLWQHNEVIPID